MGVNQYWELIHEALEKQGKQTLNYIKDLGEMKGINVESVLLKGNTSEEFIRYAKEEKMDIIIIIHSAGRHLYELFPLRTRHKTTSVTSLFLGLNV